MFASTTSVALVGVEPRVVEVEAHAGRAKGRGAFSIVGLPDTAVREARERVQAAMAVSGFTFPSRRITVNLSPADLPKAGASYDLPIALAVLAALGYIPKESADVVCIGELALDGAVRPVRDALAAAMIASRMHRRCIVPVGSGSDAWGAAADVRAVSSIRQAVDAAAGRDAGAPDPAPPRLAPDVRDLGEVRGMAVARRAVEIAAAGGHHVLLTGPPGAGKTMLARCVPGILPELSAPRALEVEVAWAAAGRSRGSSLVPPFRAPHHSATVAAMVGGGSGLPVPGEVTLAQHGVLFLDELGEYPRHVLDALRQPLEDGEIVIARKGASVRFPANLQLLAATNPCPCGYRGDRVISCACPPAAVARYAARLSGPLADRIDMRIDVPRVDPDELQGPPGEASRDVRRRVLVARKRQDVRGGLNRDLDRTTLDDLDWAPEARRLLDAAMRSVELSARGWERVRRVAVTVADLAESQLITAEHVAEAVALRGRP